MLSKFALFWSSGSQLPASTSSREEIVHRARVLRTIQPLERAGAGIRPGGGGGVDRRFERVDERGVRRRVRTRRERRRHQPRLQLANHLLRHFRVLRGARHVESGERQSAGLSRVVVARDAVAADHRVVILRSCGRGDRLHRTLRSSRGVRSDGRRPLRCGRGFPSEPDICRQTDPQNTAHQNQGVRAFHPVDPDAVKG